MQKNKVIIILPAYNEEKNILKTYKKVQKCGLKVDVIVINDGSKDNTEKICKENKINHLTLIQNLGIGGAVQTGYKYALENDYDIAIQFDGDGQHDERYIKNLIEPIIKNKADLVIGSRFINDISKFKSSFMRRLGKSILSFLIKVLTKTKITDPTSGFRAVNKKIIKLFASNYPTEYPEPESIVTIIRKGLKVKEIPVVMHERKGGKTTLAPAYYMLNVSLSILVNSLKRGVK